METLRTKFNQIFGTEAEYYAQAPGRVNLIGEHIDYCGYSVLPMAIEQNVKILAAPSGSSSIVIKSDVQDYPDFIGHVKDLDIIDQSNLKWFHYIFCGYKAIQEMYDLEESVGMNLFVTGNIPMGAGLSSSSALVVCSALAFLHANKLTEKADRTALANGCAKAERHIGTCGGGMDQSICLLGEASKAKLIHFNPLKCETVRLPEGAKFVVAHSLTKKEKALSNDFNQRVVECRLAALCLQKYKFNKIDLQNIPQLKTVQQSYAVDLPSMLNQLDFTFARDDKKAQEPFTRAEVLSKLEVTDEELKTHVLSSNTQEMNEFWLYKRAEHVFSEAFRVEQFARICNGEQGENVLTKLGLMMDGSHWSCSKGYKCSSIELDTLTDVARDSGALGSRLTGAGWGGCTVSLIHQNDEIEFLKKVNDGFYSDKDAKFDEVVFSTLPSKGAAIYDVNSNKIW